MSKRFGAPTPSRPRRTRSQLRESGEPYINHPLAVAETLASLHMDTATIVAALCHDVSEDCDVPMSELESRFGREVARLVDGVTKLDKMQFLHVDGDDGAAVRCSSTGRICGPRTCARCSWPWPRTSAWC